MNHWHAEIIVNGHESGRNTCVITVPNSKYPALARAADWLANEMTEDFKRHADKEGVRERMTDIADDLATYDGHGKGWEGWVTVPDDAFGMMIHYRLVPSE